MIPIFTFPFGTIFSTSCAITSPTPAAVNTPPRHPSSCGSILRGPVIPRNLSESFKKTAGLFCFASNAISKTIATITPTVIATIELILLNNAKNREHTATENAGTNIFIPIFLNCCSVCSFVGLSVFPIFTFLKIGGRHMIRTSTPETFAGSHEPNPQTIPKEHQKTAVPTLDGFSLSSRFLIPA